MFAFITWLVGGRANIFWTESGSIYYGHTFKTPKPLRMYQFVGGKQIAATIYRSLLLSPKCFASSVLDSLSVPALNLKGKWPTCGPRRDARWDSLGAGERGERERGETEERKVGDGYENKGEWEIRGDTLVLTQTQWYYSMVQFGNSLTTY